MGTGNLYKGLSPPHTIPYIYNSNYNGLTWAQEICTRACHLPIQYLISAILITMDCIKSYYNLYQSIAPCHTYKVLLLHHTTCYQPTRHAAPRVKVLLK